MWKPIFDGYNFINFISLRDLDSLKCFIYPFKDFWGINSEVCLGKSSGENLWILNIGLVSRLKPDLEEQGLLAILLVPL